MLNEHNYTDTSSIRFNRRSGKYLPRTEDEDKELVENVSKNAIDLEDLSYLRQALTEHNIPIKWTNHPVTKSTRKVHYSAISVLKVI